jgi:Zn-dependent peptidase ImmA (M78 family)
VVIPKDAIEREADKFATFFLMPGKHVENLFKETFGTDCFVLNNETTFYLGEGSISEFKAKCTDRRGLALHLATLDHYRVNSFYSMADVFGVSAMAMARRLEELGLVEF